MNLPEALRKQKETFLKAAPEETLAIIDEALEELSESGILTNCLKPGYAAPDFTLEDAKNKKYTLSELVAHGPVVLNFFRGDW